MARPRVFISSTFYDLRQVRTDLERFVRELGYEPVLNEHGSVPYGANEKVEEYAYKEVELSDLLVSIIGGRFGSESQHGPYSISQQELRTAVDRGKPVWVFVEKSVDHEYNTYLVNKSTEGIQYKYVDDVRVFQFIEEVRALPKNNPIATFETARDITDYLREQWAGLFQRFLQEQTRLKEVHPITGSSNAIPAVTESEINAAIKFLEHHALQAYGGASVTLADIFCEVADVITSGDSDANDIDSRARSRFDLQESHKVHSLLLTASVINIEKVSKVIYTRRPDAPLPPPPEPLGSSTTTISAYSAEFGRYDIGLPSEKWVVVMTNMGKHVLQRLIKEQ